MKKSLLLFAFAANCVAHAQSVSLATTNANPTKGTVYYNNGTNQLQYWNGSSWVSLTSASAGVGWALNGTHIYKNNSGNVGIGVTNPANMLQIGSVGTTDFNSNHLAMGNGTHALAFYMSDPISLIGATNDIVLRPRVNSLGFVGINTETPVNQLQIGSVGATSFSNNQLAIGNGTHATAINQTNSNSLISATTDIVLKPRVNGSGFVGINAETPKNKLQIGSVGPTSIESYDFALGNGSHAMGISQYNDKTLINSTTNIILRPKGYTDGNVGINTDFPTNKLQIGIVGSGYNYYDIAFGNGAQTSAFYQSDGSLLMTSSTKIVLQPSNGGGFVGINTYTPRGPLDVKSWSNTANMPFAYFYLNNSNNQYSHAIGSTSSSTASISIYAENGIQAASFIAVSDARIKNIAGVSNSAQDLATLRNLEITDYTMKDQIQFGSKSFKKVIAQQVEKVYPQAVTQGTDVVPDIYVLAENVVYDKTNQTLKCSLRKSYDVKVGEKLQFIHPTAGKVKAEVIAVSGNSFTVKDWQHATDKLFVYGREVNDFRSVDYEALSMLGISAIQQLAKENEEMKSRNEELERKNNELTRKLEQLKSDFSARLEAIEAVLGAQLPKALAGK
ncbi:tail fiber domain-containing protein [Emticicia sp. C21]|uniref:tail fiber domain-containing protein n=1 Tax=Emticicia sp. C21 TaxID=2302915 RepID=UPI000E347602|nr:tail fiber domain-containing protein [Emticicia sp. C21]RFS16890.1 hypothetical protein D0T08_09440 [Emticicia sp. C21]